MQLLNHSSSESSLNSTGLIIPAQLNIYAILGLEEPEIHVKSRNAVRKLKSIIKNGDTKVLDQTKGQQIEEHQSIHIIRNSNMHNLDLPSLISEESNEEESSSNSNKKEEDLLSQSITALN